VSLPDPTDSRVGHPAYLRSRKQIESVITFHHSGILVAPMPVLKLTRFEATIANNQPMWNSYQLCIREFNSGPCVAIVKQYLQTQAGQLCVK
jgi:hypothetical protein